MSSLLERRLTKRFLPFLAIPSPSLDIPSNLITPDAPSFPLICPPAPAPLPSQHHHHHLPSLPFTMKDQTKKINNPRISTVYPLTKRSSTRPTLSPKSMSQSTISKRRLPPPSMSSSSSYSSASSSSPDYPTTSRLVHQRALAAQRSAALAQRASLRNIHVNSLDRAIKGLLEEEYRDEVKAVMLEKEVSH